MKSSFTYRTCLAALVFAIGLGSVSAGQTPTWKAELLGTPDPGWSGVAAAGVNDVGQVVGNTYISGYKRAWIASLQDGLELLPLPVDATWSQVLEINSGGLAVGSVLVSGGLLRAIVWTPGVAGYEFLLLPSGPGGTLPFDARGVNDAGDVVGKYGVLGGSYVWNETSGVVQIPTSTFPVVPEDVNEQRQIVGDTFRMDLDTLVLEDLGSPTGTPYNYMFTKLGTLNDAGECAGYAVAATSQSPYLPVRFTDGPVWQLFSNFPLTSANALGLAATGDTVFQLGIYGLYVYVNGFGSIGLQGTLDPAYANWDLTDSFAPAISRGDRLACTGLNTSTGEAGVVLLTPLGFESLGGASRGALGTPVLSGFGSLLPGEPTRLRLASGAPNSFAFVALSIGSNPVPFFGGTLFANPPGIVVRIPTDELGRFDLTFSWPGSSGATLYLQAAVVDSEAPGGLSMSSALRGVTP